jgi:ribosomal protein S12 methylthiotransferase accessory factor
VFFPVNVIGNIFVSNGMSAGNSQNEARVQALSEIFERHVKNKIISEAISLPSIPESVLDRFPKIQLMLKELRDYGYLLKVADASLGGQYPVINVTLINQQQGSVFASFGAHPCFEVALERTVTELLQGRRLDQMDVFHPPTFDIEEVRSPQNLEMHFIDSSGYVSQDFLRDEADYPFADWDHDANTGDEFTYLSSLIHQHGFDIYIADYQHLGVYSCRIMVPGMSDIYPVDELQWENNNEGAVFREQMLALTSLDNPSWQQLLDDLEEGGYHDQALVSQFIGLLPDPDTKWATLRIGELKAMLCLALQDEAAIDWLDWCLSLAIDEKQSLYYRCIKTVLEIKWAEDRDIAQYKQGLIMLYGKEMVRTAIAIVEGKTTFHQLHCPGLTLNGFTAHQRLLEAYDKLQQAKQK